MQQRRGTAAQWTAANPVLAAGEIGFETDTSKFKMGNGSSTWTALTYFANAAELAAIIDGAPDLLNTLNELAASIGDDPAFLTSMDTRLTNIGASLTSHEQDATNIHGITNASNLVYKVELEPLATTLALTDHISDTTNIHGIADTTLLATKSYTDTAVTTGVSNHHGDTTDVHGIADTSALVTTETLGAHANDTTAIHGIADTSLLATKDYADTAVSTHQADTTSVHGISNTANLVYQATLDLHTEDSTNVHGIADTAALATKIYADGAVSTAVAALTKSSVGLANVDNTSDASKPVSTATQAALDLKAPLANPTFTGTVAGVTKAHVGLGNVDNTADSAKPVSTAQATAIATAKSEAIADATSQINAVIASAPAALNTLDELAAALGDDANFASTVTTNLAAKAPLASPTFTGTVTVAAAGVAFTDGTQTKAGVPSITNIPTALAAGAQTIAAGRADQFIPLTGAVVITLPATGYSTGQSIDFYQESSTGAYFATTNGVVGTPGLKLRTTNSVATAMKTSAGWLVFGDLSA